MSKYTSIIEEIEKKQIMPQKILNLKPMKMALKCIFQKNQLQPERTILVAGTNGKGSVCATLEALFLSAKERVGLYTSPHLEETTERIRIQGKQISQSLFCKTYKEVMDALNNAAFLKSQLTHFEILTLMAAWLFYSKKNIPAVKWAIFEVGIGGTWDATNAIAHQNAVITSLGYDHENLLGKTLTEIAKNKFGIITPFSKVFTSPIPKKIEPLMQKIQKATQCKRYKNVPVSLLVNTQKKEPVFTIKTPWGKTPLNLPGRRAAENTATALSVFEGLGYPAGKHLHALTKVNWPGRMEKITLPCSPCPIYLSGDHNPKGVQSLLELLGYYRRNHLYILIGIGKDKNFNKMLSLLIKIPHCSLHLTETPFLGLPLSKYGKWLKIAQSSTANPEDAFKALLLKAKQEDLILVTGSLYLVGFIKKITKNI